MPDQKRGKLGPRSGQEPTWFRCGRCQHAWEEDQHETWPWPCPACGYTLIGNVTPIPFPGARGRLTPEVEAAARTVARDAWGEPYRPLRGVMHWGTGPAHREAMLKKADRWERLAAAARICAEALPHE